MFRDGAIEEDVLRSRNVGRIFVGMIVIAQAPAAALAAEPKKSRSAEPVFRIDGFTEGGASIKGGKATRKESFPESAVFGTDIMRRFKIESTGKMRYFDEHGKYHDRFSLDLRYDDLAPEQNKILLQYFGDEGEFVESLALGDADLALPGARWLSAPLKTGQVTRKDFGVSAVFKRKDVRLTVLGSHSAARPKIATFRPNAFGQRVQIKDTDFLVRKFYKIASSGELPLVEGSVSVFYDDGNGYNNTPAAQTFTPQGGTRQGSFEPLVGRKDFVVDHTRGTLSFGGDSIPQAAFQSAIAVSYTNAAGEKVEKKLIKSEDDQITTELKNHYALPADLATFQALEVTDISGGVVATPSFEIDYVRKLLVFKDERPFAAEVYTYPSVQTRLLGVSYQGSRSSLKLGEPVLVGSEKVERNGEVLVRRVDYDINDSGEIDLFRPLASADSVTVGYNPAGRGVSQQLGGAALTYASKEDPLFVGLSIMSDFAPKPLQAPDLGQAKASLRVIGAQVSARRLLGPVTAQMNIEAAQSRFNPNPFGFSLVDNMEDARTGNSISLLEQNWKPASRSQGVPGSRASAQLVAGTELRKNISPSIPNNDLTNTLTIKSNADSWSSFFTKLGAGWLDVRAFRHMEIFVKGDGRGGRLIVEWGEVSEDANGDGLLQTEDVNSNGVLDSGEDTGIALETLSYGAGNNLLDGEDVDLNRRLDTITNVSSGVITLDFSGWKHFVFDRGGANALKHLRFTLVGSGEAAVADIEFTGEKYALDEPASAKLKLSTLSNYLDAAAPTILDSDVYKKLYPKPQARNTSEEAYQSVVKRDQSLALDYSLAAGESAFAKRSLAANMSEHQEVHFFLAAVPPTNASLSVQFGDSNNYFETEIPVGQIPTSYKEFVLKRDQFVKVGDPDWASIPELRIGVRNKTSSIVSGRVFFNEVYLAAPAIEEAVAYATEGSLSYNGVSLGGGFLRVPKNFRSIQEVERGIRKRNLFLKGERGLVRARYDHTLERGEELLPTRRQSDTYRQENAVLMSLKPSQGLPFADLRYERRQARSLYLRENAHIASMLIGFRPQTENKSVPASMELSALGKRDLALERDSLSNSLTVGWDADIGKKLKRFQVTPTFSHSETWKLPTKTSASRSVLARSLGAGQKVGFGFDFGLDIEVKGNAKTSFSTVDNSALISYNNLEFRTLWGPPNRGAFGLWNIDVSRTQQASLYNFSSFIRTPGDLFQFLFKAPPVKDISSLSRRVGAGFQRFEPVSVFTKKEAGWLSLSMSGEYEIGDYDYYKTKSRLQTVKYPGFEMLVSTGVKYFKLDYNRIRSQGSDGRFSLFEKTLTGAGTGIGKFGLHLNVSLERQLERSFGSSSLDLKRLTSGAEIVFGDKRSGYGRLPLFGKAVRMANELRLSLGADAIFSRGRRLATDVRDADLTGRLTAEYKFLEKLGFFLRGNATKHTDQISKVKGYLLYTIEMGSKLEF